MRPVFLVVIACLLVTCTTSTSSSSAAQQPKTTTTAGAGAATSATPYAFQPLSPHAIPSVAIIGTAKAGTTDLYALLTRTSRMAPVNKNKCMKEVKLLMEGNRTVLPGHPDFDDYLTRTGHPCAPRSTHPDQHNSSAALAAFTQCQQQLVANYTSAAHTAGKKSSSNNNNSHQLPLSIDATPFYLLLPEAMQRLRAISNDTKVIMLLRHPLDRAQSLYNHRVNTEVNHNAPARVQNRTISEWANLFLDWVDETPDVKPLLAALAQPGVGVQQQAALYSQLVKDANVLGLPERQPLSYRSYNWHGHVERNIFGTTLFAGGLAVWRSGYFKPGRVMVIDAHAFFSRRLEVMNAVHTFVHGRPLSEAGRRIATRTAVQNARRAAGVEFPGAKLDAAALQRVSDFYQPLTDNLLQEVLPAMRAEGAWVLGFDGPPWVPEAQV